jgi:hypothetical protein
VRLQLGQYAEARPALERYEREGGDRIPAARRDSLQADFETISARTATVHVITNALGADILVDDDVVGTSPLARSLLLNAGEHRLGARKPGYREKTVRQALAGRDDVTLKIDLDEIPEVPRVQVISAPLVPTAPESSRPTWRWVAWSATGALTLGTAITGGLGIQAANQLNAMKKTYQAPGTLTSQSQTANGLFLAEYIFGGAAIAAGAGALYLTLTPGSNEKAPAPAKRVGLSVGPGWVRVVGRY